MAVQNYKIQGKLKIFFLEYKSYNINNHGQGFVTLNIILMLYSSHQVEVTYLVISYCNGTGQAFLVYLLVKSHYANYCSA